jgi:hypothetical protein
MSNPASTKPALIRLGAAAEQLGLTRESLFGGVIDGTVPLKVFPVGKLYYFRAAELNAYLRGEPQPAASNYDLF